MQTRLDKETVEKYSSLSQKIRVSTESWADREIFCPSCGSAINHYSNNRPVADFYCPSCGEDYELKSKKGIFGSKVLDGAYRTMIERLQNENNPNLFLLSYDLANFEVTNFVVIPKYFFVPEIIEKRNPLAQTARRAGWVGCNILIKGIPQAGKIFYIKDRHVEPKSSILKKWERTTFLGKEKELKSKSWIIDVMNCIDKLDKKEFSLDEMYSFEKFLEQKHPNNKHIRDKIRQQLQFLRDKHYIEFVARGKYQLK